MVFLNSYCEKTTMRLPRLVLVLVMMMMTMNEKRGLVRAHVGAFHPSSFCFNGTDPTFVDQNAANVVNPLFNLTQSQWWFHHVDNCDDFPPDKGVYLEIPQNGQFTVELAVNRAFTTYSYGGTQAKSFLDGQDHPEFNNRGPDADCITQPNIHTQNESMAAGTAFAISYVNEISKVTPQNLVVFSVRYHTPWLRLTTYDVPNLPPCPSGGCICAWGWVPNGCGIPNMYMQGFRCMVTNLSSTPSHPLAVAQAPVYCEDSTDSCVKGAKQMVYWNQAEGNNINVFTHDIDMGGGTGHSPGYNEKSGYPEGAQTDIFDTSSVAPTPAPDAPEPSGSPNPPGSSAQPGPPGASGSGFSITGGNLIALVSCLMFTSICPLVLFP